MIRLYLVRNGADEDRDGTRRLTRRARRRFRRVAGAFAHLEEPVQLICAGGKPHVLETARVLARMLGRSDVVEVEELSSRAGADALLKAVSVHGGGANGIALVGNGRQLHDFARARDRGRRDPAAEGIHRARRRRCAAAAPPVHRPVPRACVRHRAGRCVPGNAEGIVKLPARARGRTSASQRKEHAWRTGSRTSRICTSERAATSWLSSSPLR